MELDPAEFDLNESNQVSTHRYVQEWRGNKVIVQRTTGVDTPVLQMYSALSNRHLVRFSLPKTAMFPYQITLPLLGEP